MILVRQSVFEDFVSALDLMRGVVFDLQALLLGNYISRNGRFGPLQSLHNSYEKKAIFWRSLGLTTCGLATMVRATPGRRP